VQLLLLREGVVGLHSERSVWRAQATEWPSGEPKPELLTLSRPVSGAVSRPCLLSWQGGETCVCGEEWQGVLKHRELETLRSACTSILESWNIHLWP